MRNRLLAGVALVVLCLGVLVLRQTGDDSPAASTDQASASNPPVTTAPLASAPRLLVGEDFESPQAALIDAIDAWRDNDWDALADIASRDAVAVAIGASGPNHEGPSAGFNSGAHLDQAWRCSLGGQACGEGLSSCSAGGTSCTQEILYVGDPAGGCCATIYRLTFEPVETSYRLTALDFAGDAG